MNVEKIFSRISEQMDNVASINRDEAEITCFAYALVLVTQIALRSNSDSEYFNSMEQLYTILLKLGLSIRQNRNDLKGDLKND